MNSLSFTFHTCITCWYIFVIIHFHNFLAHAAYDAPFLFIRSDLSIPARTVLIIVYLYTFFTSSWSSPLSVIKHLLTGWNPIIWAHNTTANTQSTAWTAGYGWRRLGRRDVWIDFWATNIHWTKTTKKIEPETWGFLLSFFFQQHNHRHNAHIFISSVFISVTFLWWRCLCWSVMFCED